jgi:putative sterol carrier protein
MNMTPTIEEIMLKLPSAFRPEGAEEIDAVVHFKFSGSEPGEWNAVIRGGSCQVARGLPRSRPTISITANSADFIGVVTGELDGMQAFMAGKLKLAGDVALAPRLMSFFRVG